MKQLNNMNIKIRLKEGDEVKVISGKDKGKIGKIKEFLRNKSMVIIDGMCGLLKKRTNKHYKLFRDSMKYGII